MIDLVVFVRSIASRESLLAVIPVKGAPWDLPKRETRRISSRVSSMITNITWSSLENVQFFFRLVQNRDSQRSNIVSR